jgi:cytochrome b561
MSPRYSLPAIGFHWLIAALILGNLAFGWIIADLPLSPAKLKDLAWHKWIGITVLWLSGLRLLWRLWAPRPAVLASHADWEKHLATLAHLALYVLMFALPLSGWLMSSAAGVPVHYLDLFVLPDLLPRDRELAAMLKNAHGVIALGLTGVIALHILGAVKHHLIDRDSTLARMLPLARRPT